MLTCISNAPASYCLALLIFTGLLGKFSPLFIMHCREILSPVDTHLTVRSDPAPHVIHVNLCPTVGSVHTLIVPYCWPALDCGVSLHSWPAFSFYIGLYHWSSHTGPVSSCCRESGWNPWGGGSVDPGAQWGFSLDVHDLQNHHWLRDHSAVENTKILPAWLLYMQTETYKDVSAGQWCWQTFFLPAQLGILFSFFAFLVPMGSQGLRQSSAGADLLWMFDFGTHSTTAIPHQTVPQWLNNSHQVVLWDMVWVEKSKLALWVRQASKGDSAGVLLLTCMYSGNSNAKWLLLTNWWIRDSCWFGCATSKECWNEWSSYLFLC